MRVNAAMKLPRILLLLALLLAGCITNDPGGTTSQELGVALSALSPSVDRNEAQRAADCIYVTAARLKREYKITSSPTWHNFLIASGTRTKGFCYHWTEDILAALRPLQLKTLDIHWAIADPGKDTESNALVLTAKGQPLPTGIVIDAWRFGGRVFWKAANADHTYQWQEDYSPYARARMAGLPPPRR